MINKCLKQNPVNPDFASTFASKSGLSGSRTFSFLPFRTFITFLIFWFYLLFFFLILRKFCFLVCKMFWKYKFVFIPVRQDLSGKYRCPVLLVRKLICLVQLSPKSKLDNEWVMTHKVVVFYLLFCRRQLCSAENVAYV